MSGLHIKLKTEMEKLAFGVLVRERKWANVVRFTAAASRLVGRWHGSALRRTRPSASLPRLSTLSTDIYQTAACCSLSQGTYFLHRYHQMTLCVFLNSPRKTPCWWRKSWTTWTPTKTTRWTSTSSWCWWPPSPSPATTSSRSRRRKPSNPTSCLLLADLRNLQLTVAVLVLVPAVG